MKDDKLFFELVYPGLYYISGSTICEITIVFVKEWYFIGRDTNQILIEPGTMLRAKVPR